ncbi:Copper amine oxidase N-terminal domain-containing protein [Acetoanaerobium noterae]|uniref:Copper amine oxidase N-terminal domain-containing protein n=1 Tax=Acetoanaerobium noterae TaxID=745369 RepID=A0A1T5AZJ3_9FIRM|nr:copper amine oxidase N-terminal domain-containing protein [Acetoanaerobium noterae]SKB40217.1 Copper amine oxidase N-terminal domain-containing protein [Acetoanaerobium noterae]
MKRKLSLLMVLMMMLTLIPANMAFAASDAVVNTTTTSADGTVNFQIQIDPKGTGFEPNGSFEIALGENAEWLTSGSTFVINVAGSSPVQPTKERETEKRVEFKMPATVPAGEIVITGKVQLDGASAGDQKVTIEDLGNSGVSRQVLTYAVVSGSGSVISRRLEDVKTVTRSAQAVGAEFELREVSAKALSTANGASFKLRLPKDMSWNQADTVVTLNNVAADVTKTFSDREMTVTFANGKISDSVMDRIIVKPVISISKDAKFGDIEIEVIDVNANMDADDVKVAEYKEFGAVLEVDKVKSIVAGTEKTSKEYTVKITLDPNGASFIPSRTIDFTVAGGDLKLKGSVTGGTMETGKDTISGKYDDEFGIQANSTTAKIEFEAYLKADWDANGELKLTAKGAGVEEQTIKLADVLAPAKITTKVDDTKTVADVVVGLQNQATPEIIITETEAGSLAEGYYVFDLNQARYAGVEFIDSTVKFETTGDISVDDVYTIENGDKVVVYVDGESNKEASSIVIKGLTVTLDRAVPFGQLDLRFGAVVADGDQGTITDGEFGIDPEKKSFEYEVETIIEKVPFLNVVTEVQTARQQKTVFTLDSTTYTVGSETKTLDAAPYISNNRTMLPIGTVAQLAGATLNYSATTRTAVFTKDNLVVSMNLDTNILLVNGSPVPMDAKPEIVNSRAFVPVVYVAQAFGIQNGIDIVYDAATRTVTLFPNAQ